MATARGRRRSPSAVASRERSCYAAGGAAANRLASPGSRGFARMSGRREEERGRRIDGDERSGRDTGKEPGYEDDDYSETKLHRCPSPETYSALCFK